ncbi:MAG TPA: 2-oxoglutarate dehydrogenase, E2 component, dihydrolipoamide succinyltransferase, partial [Terriglobales bacterium]|nr:2-oxoglutarate dehydrogenase, E2 component, dihydrolipoamide succinyltransferase [Terriglobales bacterium]
TITKWLKKPGEKVQRDEPLFEISTDKVDAEIPSPSAGVLREIKVPEGTTVQVNTVVGVIDADGAGAAAAAPAPAAAPPKSEIPRPAAAAPAQPPKPSPQADGGARQPQPAEAAARPAQPAAPRPQAQEAAPRQKETVIEFPSEGEEEGERIRSSPLVRRIAREHNVNLAQVPGTGLGGRITKQDIENFIAQHPAGAPAGAPARPAAAASAQPSYQPGAAAPAMPAPQPAPIPGELVAMSNMRKIIAQRMVESRRTSAHVHNLFEVDVTRIVQLRNRAKAGFEQRHGARLTFMPFFVRAAIIALQQFPIINASVEGDNLRYHEHINMGIAVALDWGLIVPVIKNAEEKNFLGLQRAITDVGERARSKRLSPDDIQGSTFTVTNPGTFGAVFGLPIINQPNLAILGVGGIAKAPVVVTDAQGNDSIAIRSLVHLSLGYDHRVIDGAVADQFMALLKKTMENWNEDVG